MARKKAAIVEHDASMVALYRAALSLAGYEVVGIAKDVGSAVNIVHEERPNLFLVDYRLQGNGDGLDFISQAKLLTPEVFTILITAVSFLDIVDKIERIRPDRTLQKPFMLRSLLELLTIQQGHRPVKTGTL